ncbi:PTS sugar transporter subunit IIA [Paludifilum halophilum]|uniref:PTS sugar transporter subunit IIA n=1 Tax=Paludifilum halophilum TaxID=1642702 RepID=UPI00146A3735|nr:PTS glucose transporter subunit IIA [Paludifilum halophilum]
MFKKWFKKRKDQNELQIQSPLKGKAVPLTEVPDPVFSEKMMGDGAAVIPEEGRLVSPIDGEVVQLFPTNHAVGIRSGEGVEVLLHIGLETVGMEGEGFSAHVKVGDRVKAGQSLIDFSLEKVEEKAKSTITPVVITNMDRVEKIEPVYTGESQASGETMLRVSLKE